MKYWEFFDQFRDQQATFKGIVIINESFDAERYGAIFQREVRRLKNAREYRG